jgi:hypothetical protein
VIALIAYGLGHTFTNGTKLTELFFYPAVPKKISFTLDFSSAIVYNAILMISVWQKA